jgi:protein-S-isoprenylcysteine O-methyltransferase Ste14
MMQRKKILLWSALIGAVAGAAVSLIVSSCRLSWTATQSDPELLRHWPFLLAAFSGWLIFSAYWEIAARHTAAARKSESRSSRAVHEILTNLALVLEIAPIHGLGRLLPVSPLLMTAGLVVEALGLSLAIWARRHLAVYWSGEISIKVDHQLVRSGPYRTLRHPIYTGLLTMYAGVVLVTSEWLAVIGFAVAVFAYWRKIRLEEAALDGAFGPDYDAYRRSTWSLVPGVF